MSPTDSLPEVQTDENGRPWRATIASKSSPTKEPYVLERGGAGNWYHVDARCQGFTHGGHCYHVDALKALCIELEGKNHA